MGFGGVLNISGTTGLVPSIFTLGDVHPSFAQTLHMTFQPTNEPVPLQPLQTTASAGRGGSSSPNSGYNLVASASRVVSTNGERFWSSLMSSPSAPQVR